MGQGTEGTTRRCAHPVEDRRSCPLLPDPARALESTFRRVWSRIRSTVPAPGVLSSTRRSRRVEVSRVGRAHSSQGTGEPLRLHRPAAGRSITLPHAAAPVARDTQHPYPGTERLTRQITASSIRRRQHPHRRRGRPPQHSSPRSPWRPPCRRPGPRRPRRCGGAAHGDRGCPSRP